VKRLIALLVAVAVAAVAAAVAVPALAATKTVKVGPEVRFGPSKLTIERGGTVKFRWTGGLSHNVVIKKGPTKGRISKLRTKGTVSHTFTRPGRYTIVCTVHAPDMTLKLTVK
jgi:plastocyanin